MNGDRMVYVNSLMNPPTVITWNGSATFNVWEKKSRWRNVDCFTVYGVTEVDAAAHAAEDWIDERRMWQAEAAMCRD